MKSLIITMAGLSLPSIVHCVDIFSEKEIQKLYQQETLSGESVKLCDSKTPTYTKLVMEFYCEDLLFSALNICKENGRKQIGIADVTNAIKGDSADPELSGFLTSYTYTTEARPLVEASSYKAAHKPKESGISFLPQFITNNIPEPVMRFMIRMIKKGRIFMRPLMSKFVFFGDTFTERPAKEAAVDSDFLYISEELKEFDPAITMDSRAMQFTNAWMVYKRDSLILTGCQLAKQNGKLTVQPADVEVAIRTLMPAAFAKDCIFEATKSLKE